jgi:hypothetical protein
MRINKPVTLKDPNNSSPVHFVLQETDLSKENEKAFFQVVRTIKFIKDSNCHTTQIFDDLFIMDSSWFI